MGGLGDYGNLFFMAFSGICLKVNLCYTIIYSDLPCQEKNCQEFKKVVEGRMPVMVNIKMDPKMRDALKTIAEKQFSSVSSIIKQAIEKYLQEQGIEWRNPASKIPAQKKK